MPARYRPAWNSVDGLDESPSRAARLRVRPPTGAPREADKPQHPAGKESDGKSGRFDGHEVSQRSVERDEAADLHGHSQDQRLGSSPLTAARRYVTRRVVMA